MIIVRLCRAFTALLLVFCVSATTTACAPVLAPEKSETETNILHLDGFGSGLSQWVVEAEGEAQITARNGRMEIIAPGGATVWFRPRLTAPVEISYTASAIDAGGPHDRVSDLNQFWMARPTDGSDLFAATHERTGKFSQYDGLELYYVGVGGHDNSRTRFRRYIGEVGNRPLLPEHDLSEDRFLIEPNRKYRIRIISTGDHQQFYRDGELIFDVADSEPYRSGHFGIRTIRNHMRVEDFEVRRVLVAKP